MGVSRFISLTHLSDPTLLRDLTALVAQDRVTTATLLAHLAEVDARRLSRRGGAAPGENPLDAAAPPTAGPEEP